MAADKQYADAKRALRIIESRALKPGTFITYGLVAQELGYEPDKYARHIGQVCSLIDAACYWMKLPPLSLDKVRLDDHTHNPDSFTGGWAAAKDQLLFNSANRAWSAEDIGKLTGALDKHLNGESALLQWKKIEGFGQAGLDRAISYK